VIREYFGASSRTFLTFSRELPSFRFRLQAAAHRAATLIPVALDELAQPVFVALLRTGLGRDRSSAFGPSPLDVALRNAGTTIRAQKHRVSLQAAPLLDPMKGAGSAAWS
jgi:hypothetical protein